MQIALVSAVVLMRCHWPQLLFLALIFFLLQILHEKDYYIWVIWYWESMPYKPIAIIKRCPSLTAVLVLYQLFLTVAVSIAVWSHYSAADQSSQRWVEQWSRKGSYICFCFVFCFWVVFWTVVAVQQPSRRLHRMRLFIYPLTGTEHGSQPSLTIRDRELVSVLEVGI